MRRGALTGFPILNHTSLGFLVKCNCSYSRISTFPAHAFLELLVHALPSFEGSWPLHSTQAPPPHALVVGDPWLGAAADRGSPLHDNRAGCMRYSSKRKLRALNQVDEGIRQHVINPWSNILKNEQSK